MIKVMILGLPRTATTRLYADVCAALKQREDVICLLEPTNIEVMKHVVSGVKHTHDVVGEVPLDYGRLPYVFVLRMLSNASWMEEWGKKHVPTKPFCGPDIFNILNAIERMRNPAVIKDVHLWVYLPKLVFRLSRTKFVVTLRAFNAWLASMLKRVKIIDNPMDKAGVGKFFRYVMDGKYYPITNDETLRKECEVIYRFYRALVMGVKDEPNVLIVDFNDKLSPDLIDYTVKWVLMG